MGKMPYNIFTSSLLSLVLKRGYIPPMNSSVLIVSIIGWVNTVFKALAYTLALQRLTQTHSNAPILIIRIMALYFDDDEKTLQVIYLKSSRIQDVQRD